MNLTKTSKEIGEEYRRFLEEEELIEGGDNYDFTPYNTFMNKKWMPLEEIKEPQKSWIGKLDEFSKKIVELEEENKKVEE